MKHVLNHFFLGLLFFLCVSCSNRNNLIVIGSNVKMPPGSSITEHQFLLAQPCMLTIDEQKMNYASAKVAALGYGKMPERAKEENMGGCTGVKFRLAANGTPTDVQLLHESPQGYGFGNISVAMMQASVFKEPSDTKQWYYEIWVLTHANSYDHYFAGGPEQFKKYAEFLQTH